MDISKCIHVIWLLVLLRDSGGEGAGETEQQNGNMTVWTTFAPSPCGNGHLQGYVGTCPGSVACLTRLQREPKTTWRSDAELSPTRSRLLYVPGNADVAHLTFIALLTDLQWHSGVYGSVGELGTGEGKFTAMLSFNTDLTAGERLVLSGDFDRPTVSMPMMPKLDSFRLFLRPWGFSTTVEPRVYLHRGRSAGIDRQTLLAWNLPHQFRLVSIDGQQDVGSLLSCLEKAACILRDGGIIIVDGVDSVASPARVALKTFLLARTRSAFSPLLLARNKLYLCTTNWRQRFVQHIVSHIKLIVAYRIKERTDNSFGHELTYFVMAR
ncbi:hypothetical protein LSAT2_009611 [Lamellibrachia satsuma]|nr:hypothetical protein LSAT2_009611 [Lamellibrachia satsuma]